MHILRTTTLLSCCLAFCATASAQSATDARDSLLRTDKEWSDVAATSRDVERIVSFWTDDAVIYPPGAPPISGKAAIREYIAASLTMPGFSIGWTPLTVEVSADGGLGYTTGTNRITFTDPAGKLVTARGRYVTTWRRGPDGRWRCTIDIWNEAPATPSAAPQADAAAR